MVIKVIKSGAKLLYPVVHRIIEEVINYKLCPLSTVEVFHGSFRLEKKYYLWAMD